MCAAANFPEVTDVGSPPFVVSHWLARNTFDKPFTLFFAVRLLYPFCSKKLMYAPLYAPHHFVNV